MSIARFASKLVASLRGQQAHKGPSAEELTRVGISCLENSDAVGAVEVFRQALEVEHGTAARQVNLAFALQQVGRDADATYHLQRAVGLDSQSFDAAYMLGCAHERDGDLEEAALALRQALALRPDYVQAHADLGRVLAAKGEFKEARTVVLAGLQRDPSHHALRLYLGNIAMGEGQPAEALSQYQQALALLPQAAEAHANLGRALHALGDFEAAVTSLQTALKLDDKSARTHAQAAISLEALGRLDDATAAIDKALALQPENADALLYRGIVLAERGLLDEAIAAYRAMIVLHPKIPGAHGNLGLALFERGDLIAAVQSYRAGLAIQPVAEIHDNLGNALVKLCAVDEAVEHYKHALTLQPHNLNTRCNLAVALGEAGRPGESIQAYRAILEQDPTHLPSHGNLLFNLSVDPQVSPEAHLEEARRFNAKMTSQTLPGIERRPLMGSRPLRVGFVSGDLRVHPVGFFFEGILNHLGRDGLELFAYPTNAHEDELTARIRPKFKQWRRLKGLSDMAAAQAIRDDGVDILIDLAGHTAQNRLPVFAWRPAPLQVSWLGYFASTGVQAIDYVLADGLCVPAGNENQFSERVWRLPQTRLCFTPPVGPSVPDVATAPVLRNGYVTFGSFQRPSKLTDAVLSLWGRVFAAIPNAHLVLQSSRTGHLAYAEQILTRLEQVGIARGRVTVRSPASHSNYLASYALVDIVLDTFPYTGGTTTCEALWMGVPTLTLNGNTMISRQGTAMLTAAGLPQWVAEDTDEYVAKAYSFAQDVPALSALRSSLRVTLPETPLFDPKRFAQDLHAALLGMWNEPQSV